MYEVEHTFWPLEDLAYPRNHIIIKWLNLNVATFDTDVVI